MNIEDIQRVYKESSRNEGFVNVYLYRPLGIVIALIAARLNVTPNQLSVIALTSSLVGCAFIASGDKGLAILGLIPFNLGKIIDCADGQLATLTKSKTKVGAVLDPLFDRLTDLATVIALAVGYDAYSSSNTAILLAMLLIGIWYTQKLIEGYVPTPPLKKTLIENYLGSHASGLPVLKWFRLDGGMAGLLVSVVVIFSLTVPYLIGSIILALIILFAASLKLRKAFQVEAAK